MHGRWEGEGEERKRRRHMWPVSPALGTTTVDGSDSTTTSITSESFCKDGRKISVGDCALFKPLQDTSPPFIGIIRSLTQDKKNYLQLGVNWLYRPVDVILAKGILPEAAPNEIFFSFHKDEIPAASVLHPCKVAFLRKGVELPSGISSFVCRRVYDTSNKRLWWLTDKDYINEHQEEVNKLLDKSRLEMHAAGQSEGRSPKSLNGPTSTQQLKSGSDGAQNSTSSFSSQIKGRKRDRGDQGSEIIKRERSMKIDDVNSCQLRIESTLVSEITKITDKGGLIDLEGVEKLVQLMQPDRGEKKVDIAGRMMLADVIAVTDKYDCLAKFVHLKGLSVLDGWLQEAQKGKIGDGSFSKESDRSVEEFLLALLRALDKLPVDLHALQTCNIGKSVNHLRSHKHLEIQKKARGLVDTWKKRVEAEMNMNDARSRPNQAVSWPNRPGFAEVAHGGNKRVGGSSDVPMKNSVSQPSVSKAAPAKPGHGDSSKLTSTVGSVKLSPSLPVPAAASRDSPCKIPVGYSASDMPLSTIREEKSSSSSQSQNNSQSCSSDHAKPAGSLWREDARSSTAGSFNASKTSNNASRHRKSSNGTVGLTISGVQKETPIVKCSSVERKTSSEKVPQAGLTCDRTVDVSPADNGNNHRLIVRLPNLGRSPARSTNGGALDDPSVVVSRVSSPRLSEKHDQLDRKVKAKSDSFRTSMTAGVNRELRHRNDVKDEQTGSDEGEESPTTRLDEHDRISNEGSKALDTSKGTLSSGIHKGSSDPKPGKSHEASFRSINVLIESCVKYSEAAPSMSVGDDRGMNLLASVAAGEMTKSEQVSPINSPGSSSGQEDFFTVHGKNGSCPEDVAVQSQGRHNDSAEGVCGEQVPGVGPILVREEEKQVNGGEHVTCSSARNLFEEDCRTSSVAEEKPTSEHSEQLVSVKNLQQSDDLRLKSDVKPDEAATSPMTPSAEMREGVADGEEVDNMKTNVSCRDDDDSQGLESMLESSSNKKDNRANEKTGDSTVINSTSGLVRSSVDACDIKNVYTGVKVEKEAVEALPSHCPLEPIGEDRNLVHEGSADSKPKSSTLNHKVEGIVEVAEISSASGNAVDPSNVNENIDCVDAGTHIKQNDSEQINLANTVSANIDNNTAIGVGSVVSDQNIGVHNSERKDTEDPLNISSEEGNKCVKPSHIEGDQSKECASTCGVSLSAAARSDVGAKLDFDLNEGFPADEVGQGDPNISFAPGCSTVVNMHGPLSSLPSSNGPGMPLVPVAAAAKGPFVPPENLLKNSGEIGWRGSAATSAFRPAEPRKVLEMSLTTIDIPLATAFNKQVRPPLDIDLNEPDDRLQEDMSSQCSAQAGISSVPAMHDYRPNEGIGSAPIRSVGGLDLDLNKADEDTETGHFSTSTARRFDVLSARQASSGGFSNGEVNVLRNFDLNNGPGFDEVGFEQLPTRQHVKSGLPFMPSVAGLRMSTVDFGNLSSWYPPGNSYPAVAIPSILPDRGEQVYPVASTSGAQRILGQPTAGITFGPDGYRGQVLSSSPAVGFPQGTTFPYPGFPFGTNFPLPSTSFSSGSTMYLDSSSTGGLCFSAVPSQLVGASSAVSSHYPRPYMISLPDGSTTGGAESNRRWVRHGLDLNAGPGGTDIEGRDERLPSTSRQLSVASSQTLAEEQMRMYQAAGVPLKRKEPEGGWDADRFSYKQQSSWK